MARPSFLGRFLAVPEGRSVWFAGRGLLLMPLLLSACGDRTVYEDVWIGPGATVCATDEEGILHCWGDIAAEAPADTRVVDFDMLGKSACVIPEAGSPSCWSWDEEIEDRSGLEAPEGEWVEVALTTETSTCWLSSAGEVACLGGDEWGLSDLPSVAFDHLEGGGAKACGLDASGVARCWGDDEDGDLSRFAGAAYGMLDVGGSPCGITAEGDVVCTGMLPDWGLDDPWLRTGPFVDVSASGAYCAVRDDGELDCFYYDNASGCELVGEYLAVGQREDFACGAVRPSGIECGGIAELRDGEWGCFLVHPSELASYLR